MKITKVETTILRAVGPSVFVRIHTDEGITGYGECYPSAPADGIQRIIRHMTEHLLGENPLNVDRLYEKIRRAYLFLGAQAGAVITALSGIEIALWDLAGKALGVPVYQLLGGKFRDQIRVYADCHAGGDLSPESYAARAREAVAKGFTALKFDVDPMREVAARRGGVAARKLDEFNWTITAAELDAIEERVAAIREAVGYDVDLALDMHGMYDAQSGIQVARVLEPYRLMWLEEPVPPENLAALQRVKEASSIPICVGENLYTRFGFRELFERQAADIIMPDLPKIGGLSEGRKIANMAEVYYMSFAPHNVSSPLGMMAACHCCATVPNFLILEFHALDVPHWNDLIVHDRPFIENGYVTLPDAPGLGVELNHEVAQQHIHRRMTDAYFE